MKLLTIDYLEEVDFFVLAINSHIKGYKLCWELNKKLNLNFIKNKYHKLEEKRQYRVNKI